MVLSTFLFERIQVWQRSTVKLWVIDNDGAQQQQVDTRISFNIGLRGELRADKIPLLTSPPQIVSKVVSWKQVKSEILFLLMF